jgi:thiosulfate/3-mercaptopyruvate sulfurtransferase
LPLSLDSASHKQGFFSGQPDESLVLTAEELQKRLDQPGTTLIDARAPARFRGEVEPIDPVAGHIPGAQCAAFTDNLGADGRFLPAGQLKQRFDEVLAGRAPDNLVAYCGSGVTACHNLFALCLAGYPLGGLYAGSWSEWINDPARGIATGE